MASRHVVFIIGLCITVLSCFPGCDWSDTEPQTIKIPMPPDAEEAVILLGSSPGQTVKISDMDTQLRINPDADELGGTSKLLVQFRDSNGEILKEVREKVDISESGRTDIDLWFVPITDPFIRATLAEGEIGIAINVKGWNFGSNEDIEIYLDIKSPGAQTASPRGAFWASIRSQSKVEYQNKAPGAIRTRADEPVIVNTDEGGHFGATFAIPSSLISDVLAGKVSVRAEGEVSGFKVEVPFTITSPYIYLDPATGAERSEIAVTGLSFGENEEVQIKFGDVEVARATTDPQGRFETTFRVPEGVQEGTPSVRAVGLKSGREKSFTFTVSAGSIQVHPITFSAGVIGTEVTIAGSKFAANENVIIYLDDVEIARATTDENGRFTKSITTIPKGLGKREGVVFVRAVGERSGCEATIPFNPLERGTNFSEVYTYPYVGFTGAEINVECFFFGEKEDVVVYLGEGEVARATADEWGHFKTTFKIPEDTSVGETIVKAKGEKSGNEAESKFVVTTNEPVIYMRPAEGPIGAEIAVDSFFFGVEENVVIYLGDTEVARAQTNEQGYSTTTYRVPEGTPLGETIVKTIGERSRKEAEREFTIREPYIFVSPGTEFPGEEIKVYSYDFGEEENVVIYLGEKEIARTQTDRWGYFEVTCKIPDDIPAGGTIVKAIGEDSHREAEGQLIIDEPYIFVYPYSVYAGEEIKVYSYDFGEEENVVIYLDDKEIARTQTGVSGYFSITFGIPEDTPAGGITVKVIGEKSRREAEREFTIDEPYIYLDPYEGSTGREVRVYSYDFGEEENVVISLGDREIARTQTGVSGYFSKTFRIPEDTPVGETIVKVIGEKSGRKAERIFTVREPLIHVYPDVGFIGGKMIVYASFFGVEENVDVYLGDQVVDTAPTNEQGSFGYWFLVPEGVPLGEILVVKAIGEKSGHEAEAEFTVAPTPIYVDPAEAAIGEVITVSGWGFGENAEVLIDFGDIKEITKAIADENGHFEAAFEVPEGVPSGVTFIRVEGLESGTIGKAVFIVKP